MKTLTLVTAEEAYKAQVLEMLVEAQGYNASECVMLFLVDGEWRIRTSGNTSASRALGAIEIVKYHILQEHCG